MVTNRGLNNQYMCEQLGDIILKETELCVFSLYILFIYIYIYLLLIYFILYIVCVTFYFHFNITDNLYA